MVNRRVVVPYLSSRVEHFISSTMQYFFPLALHVMQTSPVRESKFDLKISSWVKFKVSHPIAAELHYDLSLLYLLWIFSDRGYFILNQYVRSLYVQLVASQACP